MYLTWTQRIQGKEKKKKHFRRLKSLSVVYAIQICKATRKDDHIPFTMETQIHWRNQNVGFCVIEDKMGHKGWKVNG